MNGVRWFNLSLVATILAIGLPARAAEHGAAQQQFQQAIDAIKNQKIDEGLTILQAIAHDPKIDRDSRLRAFWKIVEVDRAAKKPERAIAVTNEMIEAFPRENTLLEQIYSAQSDLWGAMHKTDQAVEACHQVVAHAGGDRDAAVAARFRAASHLQQARDYAQLYDEATRLLALLDDDPRAAEALWYMVEATWPAGRYDECLEKARRIVAEYPHSANWQSRMAHQRVVDCLRKLEKPGEISAFYEEWEKKDPDAHLRQKWCLAAADSYAAEKDTDAALAAYRRVIAGHCDDNVSDLWYDAESKIVDSLAASGDFKAAIEEAHILFNAARPVAITQAAHRVIDLFNKLDHDSIRADRFIAFQCHGPNGPDGEPGTDDDLTNPLDEIGYPVDQARRRALLKAFASLGNDAEATCHRGMICLYLGEPKDALAYFMEATRRSDMDNFDACALPMIVNGLRAVRGHSVGLDDAVHYVLDGPGGADGKPGMQDPFKPYASLAPHAPFAVTLAHRDVEMLTGLRTSLMASATDPTWPVETRRMAFAALARVNESLEAADWYRGLLLDLGDASLKPAILSGALSAARGDALHLGDVRAFLASVDPEGRTEKQFRATIRNLEQLRKPGSLAPRLKPRTSKRK